MGGDCWFTYVYESQIGERIRAAERAASPRKFAALTGSSSSRHPSGAIR